MLKLVRSLVVWNRMRKLYLEGRYLDAAAAAGEYRRTCIVDNTFQAFDATLDVLVHRSEQASKKFSEVLRRLERQRRARNARYLRSYCNLYIAMIEGADPNPFYQELLQTPETSRIRRILPVPEDATFDFETGRR
jgi:hypothetical protein